MTGWLLDTNVLSELRRPRPESKVIAFIKGQKVDLLYASEVTFAEIRFGIEQVHDPVKRAHLGDWLALRMRPMFTRRTLSVTEDVLLKWRLLIEEGRRAGHTYSQPDLMIAATALNHGLTVVSRDTNNYLRARCPVFSPWMDELP